MRRWGRPSAAGSLSRLSCGQEEELVIGGTWHAGSNYVGRDANRRPSLTEGGKDAQGVSAASSVGGWLFPRRWGTKRGRAGYRVAFRRPLRAPREWVSLARLRVFHAYF